MAARCLPPRRNALPPARGGDPSQPDQWKIGMTRTYIIGAGASRHAGYPLASEMGDALLNFKLHSEDLRLRASAEYLIGNFGIYSNVEDLITACQRRIKALGSSVD